MILYDNQQLPEGLEFSFEVKVSDAIRSLFRDSITMGVIPTSIGRAMDPSPGKIGHWWSGGAVS